MDLGRGHLDWRTERLPFSLQVLPVGFELRKELAISFTHGNLVLLVVLVVLLLART